MAAVDERVKGELYGAVKDELRWFEAQVAVRDRRGSLANEEVTKPTGEMIAALFQHETSRTNDPDFHVHTLIGNVTWNPERKGYFAIHYGRMLELRKTLDARIHNNLAARMGDLGYHVETAPAGFGLKEVPPSTVALFSERGNQVKTVKGLLQRGYTAAQITRALKGLSEDQKRQLLAKPDLLKEKLVRPESKPIAFADHKIDQQAVTLTRPKKVRISRKTLREDVAQRLNNTALVLGKPSLFPVANRLDLNEAVQQGTQLAFEKQSVVRLDYLMGEIVRLAPGAIANAELAKDLRNDRRFLIRRMDRDEVVTTRQILGEEKTLLTSVIMGMGQGEPLQKNYIEPAALTATPQRIDELVEQARGREEQLAPAQAEKWLNQFAAIHRYVCTSKDQFLNIRGGAGTGKTFCLEQLVGQSLHAGRPVFICAPYGEQARVTLRNEAPRLEASGQKEIAHVFAQANTVDALLAQARHDPLSLRGSDIYVDEAGLLDTPKALALVREAERANARVIFQGDTEQMAAVGRGQPVKLLQDELGLGMHVPRASISRRQLTVADKQLAADLSSGDENKFARAVGMMIDRGMSRRNVTRGYIATLFNFGIRKNLCSSNPCAGVDKAIVERAPTEVWAPAETITILKIATEECPELLCFLVLALFSGIRTGELFWLHTDHLRLDQGVVTVPAAISKTRKLRNIPIAENLSAWLAHTKAHAPSGRVWEMGESSLHRRYRLIEKGATFKWRRNALRHTFASCHLALHDNEYLTSRACGNTPRMLREHYDAIVSREHAHAHFNIFPSSVLHGQQNGKKQE